MKVCIKHIIFIMSNINLFATKLIDDSDIIIFELKILEFRKCIFRDEKQYFFCLGTGYHLRSITLSPSVCKPLAARKDLGLVVLRQRLPSPPSTRFSTSLTSLSFSFPILLLPSIPVYFFLSRIYFQSPFPFETSRKDACGIHEVRL